MIVGFFGTIADENNTPISGNGKTCCMTGTALIDHLNGREIWTNYKTDFSELKGFQEMISDIVSGNKPEELVICISEMQHILNSIGSSTNQVLFIDTFASQLRKFDVTVYYDTQRFMNIHKRLRMFTDVQYIPIKKHLDNTSCNFNNCKKPHKIYLYSYKPYKKIPVACFDAVKVGQHYNTNEIIMDKLLIPSRKKGD